MSRSNAFGGHRLLIASLFLPDTLYFPEPEPQSDSPEGSAPASPLPPAAESPFPGGSNLPTPPSSALNVEKSAEPFPAPVMPKSHKSSFNETKRIDMSSLIAEAVKGPHDSITRSQPPSPSHGQPPGLSRRPSGSFAKPAFARLTPADLPIAPGSDHGRSATADAPSPSLHASAPFPGPAPRQDSGSSLPKSRRTSFNTNAPSGNALSGASGGQEISGTRTPGAKAGGLAGTMTPLSIIHDLAAKQGAPHPTQTPTAGDSERHHPFSSGTMTPLSGGGQASGSGQRPPMPNRPKSFVQQALNKAPIGLSMSKALNKVKDAPAGTQTASAPVSGRQTPARGPMPSSNIATGRTTSAVASGTINDHGRGLEMAVPSPSPSPAQPSSAGERETKHASTDKEVGEDEVSPTGTPQATTRLAVRSTSMTGQGPPAAPSSSYARSKSKSSARANFMRRQSSVSRSLTRRASTASIETDGTSAMPPYEFAPNPSANGGLFNAVNSVGRDRLRAGKVHIGTLGIETEGWLGAAEKDDIERRARIERSSVPVWVEDHEFESSYEKFCKQILWPTFHYTLPTQTGLEHEHESFRSYVEVNRKFAETIEEVYQEGDIIWINDYHLLLVPQMIRERLPHATIGMFLHIAFPSSEIFRCLSVRETLLKGMLGADLIGFQTHNFCRHFRQTVSRILQLEATPKGIQLESGFVTVSPFPIGIDVRSLNAKRRNPAVAEWVTRLRERYEGKKVIVGRDKLDWIKGVRQKLLAFEVFLNEHPEWVGEVVLIQVALATTEENEEIGEATDVVARINNKYSTLTYQPVVFLHVQDITFSQYIALLTVADAFLASSLREGMNLTSHEYVVCQEARYRPLILSEFTGTYSALRACIGINPWNTKQTANAIHKALTMDENEMLQRWKDLHRTVVTQTAQHWIVSLLSRLERSHLEQQRRDNIFIPRLEIPLVVSEWRAAKTRLLLLDLEETLVVEDPLTTHQQGFEPPKAVVKLLQDLTEDPKNSVYVVSGKGIPDLDKIAFKVPRIGLVAENGCFVKHSGEGERHWTSLVAGFNMQWRGPVKEILLYFTERTPGSWIEDRGASICWRFWTSAQGSKNSQEAQWARRQAAEVQNLIYDSLGERFSLRIIPGATSFLIMPKNTSRASAVQHLLQMSAMGGSISPISISAANTPGLTALSSPPLPPKNQQQQQQQQQQQTSSQLPMLSPYKQPSNQWPMQAFAPNAANTTHTHHAHSGLSGGAVAAGSASGGTDFFTSSPSNAGSFDFVLTIGQDERLLSFANSLDLPFAPLTVTTADLGKNKGSEAAYHLRGEEDVKEALEEVVGFRVRDARWGGPVMVDV